MRNAGKIFIIPFLSLMISFFVLHIGEVDLKAVANGWFEKKNDHLSVFSKFPILLYHNIIPDEEKNKSAYAVKVSQFIRHLDVIKELGMRIVPLEYALGEIASDDLQRGKYVVLTFDDAYENFYSVLFPLIKKYKIPVTLFVYTDGIGLSGKKVLTWKKLREMAGSGYVDIQCHSRRHVDLISMSSGGDSPKRLYDEIFNSKRIIELQLGKPVKYFALPYGRYGDDTLLSLKLAGYSRVFTTDFGRNNLFTNNFAIKRHHIKSSYSDEVFKSTIK